VGDVARYPALDVRSLPTDALLAAIDGLAPTAVEERDGSTRIFFASAASRDRAGDALGAAGYSAEPIDVDDEDWARRSQESLRPITAGRVTIAPPWHSPPAAAGPRSPFITIQPSMGFGTGHHATTRLCVRALQAIALEGRSVLDVGTGSGVLAIAAVRLGAARAVGVDYDADAIRAAEENLTLNPDVAGVEFRLSDIFADPLPSADVITANLTGAVLIRAAGALIGLLQPQGTLIVSGLLEGERDDVLAALLDAASRRAESALDPADGLSHRPDAIPHPPQDSPRLSEEREEGWMALRLKLV
jgi:ribosomal protein L11 methyltransferase